MERMLKANGKSVDVDSDVRIPHRTFPDQLGELVIFRFPYKSSNDSPTKRGILSLVGQVLTSTNLAVEEAGYSSPPSVLVVLNSYDDLADAVSVLDGAPGYAPVELSQKIEDLKRMVTTRQLTPPGTGKKEAQVLKTVRGNIYADSRKHGSDLAYNQTDFLSRVSIHKSSLVHFITAPVQMHASASRSFIQNARELFDFVLISEIESEFHKKMLFGMPAKKYVVNGYSKLQDREVNPGEKVIQARKQFEPVTANEGLSLVFSSQGKKADVKFLFESDGTMPDKYYGEKLGNLLPHESVSRASDIARDILGVPVAGVVTERVEQPVAVKKGWGEQYKDSVPASLRLQMGVGAVTGSGISSIIVAGDPTLMGATMAGVGITAVMANYVWPRISKKRSASKAQQVKVIERHRYSEFNYPTLSVQETGVGKNLALDPGETIKRVVAPKSAPAEGRATPIIPMTQLQHRIDMLESAWMDYELNPLKLLDYPLMTDATCEPTAKFFAAWRELDMWRAYAKSQEMDEKSQRDFSQALRDAENAFHVAENNAKKMRHAHLDTAQRKKIKDARPMVAMIQDEGVSAQEKMNAFRKANDFLEGIMILPEKTVMGLLDSAKD